MKKLELVDSYLNNKDLCVDILIGSGSLWNIFKSEITQDELGTPITMKTKFGYVWMDQCLKFITMMVLLNSNCHSLLKCATEISDSDSILHTQKKIEMFSEIERFALKLTTPLFTYIFLRIFVTTQMKPVMKLGCPLKMIITSIIWKLLNVKFIIYAVFCLVLVRVRFY